MGPWSRAKSQANHRSVPVIVTATGGQIFLEFSGFAIGSAGALRPPVSEALNSVHDRLTQRWITCRSSPLPPLDGYRRSPIPIIDLKRRLFESPYELPGKEVNGRFAVNALQMAISRPACFSHRADSSRSSLPEQVAALGEPWCPSLPHGMRS
jgi:hypothetical protein